MIIGIYGFQDSGKTTLLEETIRALAKKGYKVASMKHAPHDKSVDSEGKDTWRHWKAGSDPVIFLSNIETSIIKHLNMPEEDVADIIEREFHPDVIIIEGSKEGKFAKVAVGGVEPRPGTVLKSPSVRELVAYIEGEVAYERSLLELPGLNCGKCGLDCDRLARAIAKGRRKVADCKELSDIQVDVIVGGKRIPTGRFVSQVVDGTVRGMLGTIKGYGPGKDVEIRLSNKKKKPKGRSPRP